MNAPAQKWLQIAILILATSVLSGCMYSTGPNEVGVRVRKIGLKKGVEQEPYPPGATYFFLPFINDWYTFDTKLQNLEMTADVRTGDRRTVDELRFKTVDGNDIGLDVIFTYRIDPKMAANILQFVAKSDRELRDVVVRTVARSRPRDIFGQLKTEQFYISEERDQKAVEAKDELNAILSPLGVIVERVSTKDYRFNPQYQKAIEDKKVADQMAEKYKSEASATKEEYLKRVEQASGEVNQMVAKADGEFLRAKVEADAYYEQQSKRAEAIRAEGEAQAKGITEMNKALAGSGGETMVKMKLAEALAGKKIILLPMGKGGLDLKTTNINDLLEIYGVKSLSEEGK